MFEIRVRVGLSPELAETFSSSDIRNLFKEAEMLFKKAGRIDVTFLIKDKDIAIWDIHEEKRMKEKSFKKLYKEIYSLYPTTISEGKKLILTICNLCYSLGVSDVDILVGLVKEDLAADALGVAFEELKTCCSSLAIEKERRPVVLVHEILHLFGAKHTMNPFSLMFPGHAVDVGRNELYLEENIRRKVIKNLKKLKSDRSSST